MKRTEKTQTLPMARLCYDGSFETMSEYVLNWYAKLFADDTDNDEEDLSVLSKEELDKKIEEEEARILFLDKEREKRSILLKEKSEQLNQLQSDNKALEKDLFSKTNNLIKAKEHLPMATSQK